MPCPLIYHGVSKIVSNSNKYNPKLHHRKSIRLKEYDYSNPWWYHVTICTDKHINIFGQISNAKMLLNDFGSIAEQCWKTIPKHFPNTELDYYVIMPNHIHGIVIINYSLNNGRSKAYPPPASNQSKFGKPKPGSLPTIIGSFKSAVSKQINLLKGNSGKSFWQRNYYERIIRNDKELYNIRRYIELNPLKWELDEFYKRH